MALNCFITIGGCFGCRRCSLPTSGRTNSPAASGTSQTRRSSQERVVFSMRELMARGTAAPCLSRSRRSFCCRDSSVARASSASTICGRSVSSRRWRSRAMTIDGQPSPSATVRTRSTSGLGAIRGLDPIGPHARRAVQSPVSTTTAAAGSQPALHPGGVSLERQPVDVHQSRRRSPVARPDQRSAGGHAVRAPPGVKASSRTSTAAARIAQWIPPTRLRLSRSLLRRPS
jgi:hypothetical protein